MANLLESRLRNQKFLKETETAKLRVLNVLSQGHKYFSVLRQSGTCSLYLFRTYNITVKVFFLVISVIVM